MIALHRSRPQQIAAAFVFFSSVGMGFIPLFGGPGYEQALGAGLLVPSAAAIATALDLSLARGAQPLACAFRGMASGLSFAVIAYVVAVVHGLFAGTCDFWGGSLYYAVTAGIGAVLGGAWGSVVAEVGRNRRWRRLVCVTGGLALPLGAAIVSVVRYYTSPIIFAFDPFVGYFSGSLYDTVIEPGVALYTYRIGSAATLSGLVLLASVLGRDDRGLVLPRFWKEPASLARAVFCVVAFTVSFVITLSGAKLGHWQTASTIKEALGGFREGERCDIVYPDSLRPDEIALAARDCEEELASVELALGARGPDKVTAFFFRDAGEKKRLMGAENTYIAKPWRHEVYLQHQAYPHPVLGHELAHVVAGSFGRGPFRVAGALGGFWPNPGLIEGTAVAASPDDDDLTDAEWAKAMLDLGLLPPMRQVFSFDFLGQNSAKSYTIAGAFIRWLIDTRGSDVVRAWYGGEPIERACGKTLDQLDEEFRAALGKLALLPDAISFAKAKFDRPSVFGRKCPHVVDALKRDAARCAEGMQIERALALYGEALARDPNDFGTREQRGAVLLRYADAERGREELASIVNDPKTPRTWKDRAEEAIADGDLLAGDFAAAAQRYRALAERTVDEDVGRTLEVKAIAATNLPARRAVEALLVGAPGRPPDPWLAALYLGTWAAQERDAVADYVIGRNLAQKGWYPLAARYLDRAIGGEIPTARIGRELVRQRAISACAMDDAPEVSRMRAIVEAPGSPFEGGESGASGGRRESVMRLLGRCARTHGGD